MKTVVRLLVAATVALGAAPVIASSASAEVTNYIDCGAMGGFDSSIDYTFASSPGQDYTGGVVIVGSDDGGRVCMSARPTSDALDDATDIGTLELHYSLDGVETVERTTFSRARTPMIGTIVPDGRSRLADISAKVTFPRRTVTDERYTEEVACTTPGVVEVERDVVRKVPSIVEKTSHVTRKPTADVRYAARAGLTQKNRAARATYIRAAKRAEARGNDARGDRLRAKFAKVRAANVAAYRKAMAPERVKIVTQSVVYRDTVVKETVTEARDHVGTCTVSGTRAVVRTVDEVHTSPVVLASNRR